LYPVCLRANLAPPNGGATSLWPVVGQRAWGELSRTGATAPPVTAPPVTAPPVTAPPVTAPPAAEPAAAEPAGTVVLVP